MKKQHIRLSKPERQELEKLYSKRNLSVKMHKRVSVLLLLDSGKSYKQVGQEVGLTYPSMQKIVAKYKSRKEGSRAMNYLADKPRSGRPVGIGGKERAQITALACSSPPTGHATWTLRLLADKIVELGICEKISHMSVSRILKKTTYVLT